jgi:IPT/TIG domain
VPVKNAVAKTWSILPSSDGKKWSAWPAGDKYGATGPNIPVIFFADLSDGPKTGGQNNNGAPITIKGRNFGATRGTGSVTLNGVEVALYRSWSDTQIVFELGNAVSTGNFVVQNNDGLSSSAGGRVIKPNSSTNDFTVRTGNIKFVAPSGTNGTGTFSNPIVQGINRIRDNLTPGDIFIFRGGTYNQQLVVNGWGNNVLNVGGAQSGSPNAHTVFMAYPGETVTLDIPGDDAIYLRDNNETVCSYVTFAGFNLRGEFTCFAGGAQTSANAEVSNSGGQYAYLINNDIQCRYIGNTQTGMVSFGGNGCMALGNTLHDTGYPTDATIDNGTPVYYNQNHGFYVQVGANDVVIAFNTLRNLNMGATIQVHTDSFFEYTNVRILYNHFILTTPATHQMRGIVLGHMYGTSTGVIVGNVFDGIGGNTGVSPIICYGGQWDIDNNTIVNVRSGAPAFTLSNQVSVDTYRPFGANYAIPQVRLRNNIFHGPSGYIVFGGAGSPAGNATSAQITVAANNLYFGSGAGPSFDTTKVQADPLFSNLALESYLLASSSPARNAGTLTGLGADALRDRFGIVRPQESLIDIGAHEYA